MITYQQETVGGYVFVIDTDDAGHIRQAFGPVNHDTLTDYDPALRLACGLNVPALYAPTTEWAQRQAWVEPEHHVHIPSWARCYSCDKPMVIRYRLRSGEMEACQHSQPYCARCWAKHQRNTDAAIARHFNPLHQRPAFYQTAPMHWP